MRILISNDDGIYSPGIAALAHIACKFGDVRVVAPDVEQSSASHAITASRPLRYRRTDVFDDVEAYRVNGTPADCVALGIYHWDHVDVVLSGINLGPNLGNATWHSGTLAAAKQAVLLGVRGIAFSAPIDEETSNVNFPREPKGMRWTTQAVDRYDGKVVPAQDPMGRDLFWFTVAPIEQPAEGTDLWAFQNGYVTLTPLGLDLTNQDELAWAQESIAWS
jgi:5'-nucleotidase